MKLNANARDIGFEMGRNAVTTVRKQCRREQRQRNWYNSEHLCVAMDLVKYSSTRIASFVSFKSEIATNDSKPRSSIEFHSASPEIKEDEKKNREQNGVKLSLEFVVFCIFLFFFFLAIVPKAHPTTAGNTKYASKAKSKRWRKRRKKKSRTRKEKKVSPKQKV